MRIYIPTRGRIHKQTTYEQMSNATQRDVWFVVCPEEEKYFSQVTANVLVCDKKGVPAARQAAIDHARDQERYVMFLDDDLKFAMRNDPDDTQLTQINGVKLDEAFQVIEQKFDYRYSIADEMDTEITYPIGIVGMDARGGNNNRKDSYWEYNTRQMRAFAVDTELLGDIRFDKYLFWEDFHVTLALLKRKIANAVSVTYVNNATTNSAGGCSLYRNAADLARIRKEFLAEHAPYAVAVDKDAGSWSGDLGGHGATVPDLRISWKQAFQQGKVHL